MSSQIHTEIVGGLGIITLQRPKALNALSLDMVRDLMTTLLDWESETSVQAVMLRGSSRTLPDGSLAPAHFCAGGDIRFMHEAAMAGDPALDDFFTEEYALDHFIHGYPKPVIAWLEGIVMGGGMGLAQGADLRVATPQIKMAMPETRIGLFPDVAGGYFLSRLPGAAGEYLGVVGQTFNATDALHWGLVDVLADPGWEQAFIASVRQQPLTGWNDAIERARGLQAGVSGPAPSLSAHQVAIDRHFGLDTLDAILASLASDPSDWAQSTLKHLSGNSPLMMKVTLRQIREARSLNLAEVFRLERNLVRQCFAVRKGAASETVEGVRALAVDKDHQPRWQPAHCHEVTDDMVQAFFDPPWPAHAHPLRDLE